jgi:hypothetical protein
MSSTISLQPVSPFSNLQMELLKLFARQLSDDAADKVWAKNNWTAADAERMANEHHRAPSKT